MQAQQLHEGMKVRTADGQNLGKLVARGQEGFTIEKGFFFPKEYIARYEEIADVREDEVWLRQTGDELREGSEAIEREHVAREERASSMPGRTPVEGEGAMSPVTTEQEVRVPLAEEELEATKHEREAGEVRVRKDVTTEEKNITVPVTREEVHVERVPASGEASEASFQEEETRVPVHEEEIEVHKRPVVREEVRVSKTAHQEQEQVGATTRKEHAEIDKEGEVKKGNP